MSINYRLNKNDLERIKVKKNFFTLKQKKRKEEKKEKLTKIQYILLNIIIIIGLILVTYALLMFDHSRYISFLYYSLFYIVYREVKKQYE